MTNPTKHYHQFISSLQWTWIALDRRGKFQGVIKPKGANYVSQKKSFSVMTDVTCVFNITGCRSACDADSFNITPAVTRIRQSKQDLTGFRRTHAKLIENCLCSCQRTVCWDSMVDSVWPYSDVVMGSMASQIASRTIVYSSVHSGANQRKH